METITEAHLNYHVSYGLVMFAFAFIFYTWLGIYLSNVLPHAAGGFRRHPCYCFGVETGQGKFRKKRTPDQVNDIMEGIFAEQKASNFEIIDKDKYSK